MRAALHAALGAQRVDELAREAPPARAGRADAVDVGRQRGRERRLGERRARARRDARAPRRRRRRVEGRLGEAVRGVAEAVAAPFQVRDEAQQAVVRQQQVPQHRVEERVVRGERGVDVRRAPQLLLEARPARADDVRRGVKHERLRKVQHALPQQKRRRERRPRRAAAAPALRRLLVRPATQQPPLDALRAKDAPKGQLVLDDAPPREQQRGGPRRAAVQDEGVHGQ